ncbi:MAG: response regulator [Acidobacteria bacterium]|nr:response regulator [Acidobacteriota bacterium]
MPRQNTEKLILIVDDSKDIRDVYGHFLKEEGFRVASATDGQEALEEAVKLQPD